MKKLQLVKLFISVFFLNTFSSVSSQTVVLGSAPNLWFAQPAVIIGEGWDKELGININLKRYPGPANLLQAFVAGEIDGMNNNIGAAMLAKSRGISLKLVSGTIIGDINLIANEDLVLSKKELGPVDAIKKFTSMNKRKLILVTNPKGSLSDLNAKFWLANNFPDFESYITLIHAGDQAQFQQIFINGRADLLAGFAPLKQIITSKRPKADYFLPPEELMKNQPGGALAIKTSYIETHSAEIEKLKALYQRATDFMKNEPEKSSIHIEKYLLQGLLDKEVIKEVLIERKDFLTTDLKIMRKGTQEIHNLMLKDGYIKNPIDLDSIFE